MKKDSAARAKQELLGKRLGSRTLYVHWAEASQLSPERLHSRCLCLDKLPQGYADVQELRRMAAAICEPEFCQLAVGQDGALKGFAVLEFPTPEAAERAQEALDGAALAGSHIRASFCAPGPPGRSMLAALIAAQGTAVNRGRGLLPEPSALQILSSLGNPASLQLLLNPLLHPAKQGILGAAPALPLVTNPALSAALLQLALHCQPQKPGILGDSPLSSLAPAPGKLLGEIPAGAPLVGDPAQRDKGTPGTPLGPPKPKGQQGQGGAPAVSLLGEPPKELRVPLNPYLNLHSLLRPAHTGKGFGVKRGVLGTPPEFPQVSSSSPSLGFERGALGPPLFQGSPGSSFSSGLQAGLRQSHLGKAVAPSSESLLTLAPPGSHLKTPVGGHKRAFSQLLPSPEPSPEGCYVGQHSQGLGGHYADSYLKRKRIF